MRATVRIRTSDGAEWELEPGDVIGRSRSAALQVDDAGVSEAHALVSLRGDELRLLSLRGAFSLGGPPLEDVALSVGQRLWLTRTVAIDVVEVELPEAVLGLRWGELSPRPLTGVTSLHASPARLTSRFEADALVRLWSLGGVWRLQVQGAEPVDAVVGTRFSAGGVDGEIVEVPLRQLGTSRTIATSDAPTPLHVRATFDAAHLHRAGREPVTLSGILARIISELLAMGGSAPWDVVAGEIWSDVSDRNVLRRRWDVHLARLRGRLRDAGVRTDLLRAHGTGTVELVRYPGDVFEGER